MLWILVTLSACIGLGSFAAAIVFALSYWKRSSDSKVDQSDSSYSVAVILCVRGNDPYLRETVFALLEQEYSQFRVVAVVDHRDDPAWATLQQVKNESTAADVPFEIQELAEHASHRGLKCSALLQAIHSVNEDVIVTIDSDAVPNSSWLTTLLAPFSNPKVGATTGNQWFEPTTYQVGTWARSVWHAGAIVPTAVLGNPWAGAFAMRRIDLYESGLINDWNHSIIDDGPVRSALKRLNKSLVFVPTAISVNREDCELKFCFRYVARMLTWSRLFETTFWITLLHMIVYVGVNMAAVIVLFAALFVPVPDVEFIVFGCNLSGLLGLQIAGYFLIRATVLSNQEAEDQITRKQDSQSKMGLMSRLLMALVAFPLTLSAYAYGAIAAVLTREISWRQVRYRVRSGLNVELLSYQPFEDSPADPTHSI